MLLTQIEPLDELLQHHVQALGKDFTPYRNHTYRVINFCAALTGNNPESLQKMAIAAVFHDLGIWTHGTFDYLSPSMKLAQDHLMQKGNVAWVPEIDAMILEHHKITRYKANPEWLVESFRKADWVDVSMGIITFGLRRDFLQEVFSTFPKAGFHMRLVQLSLRRLLTHPWSPLPMMRL
jgi:hypothetical protein